MNIEIAERLMKLRKEKGYSQEELADKLGISRQAVSKWERAEASPDTDNLIELAKLYGVSLDELLGLNSEKTEKTNKNEDNDKNNSDYVRVGLNGIHIKDKDGTEVHIGGGCGINIKEGNKKDEEDEDDNNEEDDDYVIVGNTRVGKRFKIIQGFVFSILLFSALFVYLAVGLKHKEFFSYGWLLFFVPIIVDSIFQCIWKERADAFAYPLLITGIYLLLGLLKGIWHPTWVLFITIPIFYTLAEIIKRYKRPDDVKFKTKGAIEVEIKEKNKDEEN